MRRGATLAFVILLSIPAAVSARWVKGSTSQSLGPLVANPVLPELYLSDLAAQQLAVVDSRTEEVTARYAVADRVWDLAVSLDGSRVAVAAGPFVGILNTQTRVYRDYPLPLGVKGSVVSIAFHRSGALFVGVNTNKPGFSPSTLIYVFDPEIQTVLTSFHDPTSPHPFYFPLLRTDESGSRLFLGERGLSISPIYLWDVEYAAAPIFLSQLSVFVTSIANLQDMVVSTDPARLFVASGAPYGLLVYPTPSFENGQLWSTGPYPTAVALSTKRRTVFLAPGNDSSNDLLYEFDAESGVVFAVYAPDDETPQYSYTSQQGLALAGAHNKIFVVHGNSQVGIEKLQVIDLFPRVR
ncbi:MAG: hypothetical protein ABJC13_10235 [Acidobacteriota bacterium]